MLAKIIFLNVIKNFYGVIHIPHMIQCNRPTVWKTKLYFRAPKSL